jgi:hypothetical protein
MGAYLNYLLIILFGGFLLGLMFYGFYIVLTSKDEPAEPLLKQIPNRKKAKKSKKSRL